MRKLVCSFLVLFSLPAFSTLFQPINLKKHLIESDGIVEGSVLEMESLKDENAKIVTKVTIMPDRWIGDFEVSSNKIEIYYPGGKLGQEAREIIGAPEFEVGENIIVLTREYKGLPWVSNLGLGKYTLSRVSDKKIMVNQIFPQSKKMGTLKTEDFYVLATEVKGKQFSYRFKEKYELHSNSELQTLKKTKKPAGRNIASVSDPVETQQGSKFNSLWLVLALGLLGVGFKVANNKMS